MTGEAVTVADLVPGDVIHLEPHTVGTVPVTRILDVEVVQVRDRDPRPLGTEYGPMRAIDWRLPARFTGSSPAVSGTTVYRWDAPVLRIGSAA